ncbi:hypothetical protein FKP32DRAFT_1619747 [Trametes sanguinea]|nr:hypothetical protein FKP32DRAFT_1619747 [Trametes sanguinea]
MIESESDPVLVVGAGPAGLIAALTLVKQGVPVKIIEKLPAFHTTSRGNGAQPRSLEIYHFLGMLDDYLRVATPLPEMRAYKLPGGTEALRTWRVQDPIPPTPDRPILGNAKIMLGQYRLESIFRDHLAKHGVQVELATELVDFKQDERGVTATLKKNGTEVVEARVAYLVGADGAKGEYRIVSAVTRKLIGATFVGQTRDEDGQVWADIELEGPPHEYWNVFTQPGKFNVSMRATGDSPTHFQVGILGIDFDPVELTDPKKFVKFIEENIRPDFKFLKFKSLTYWKPNIRMVDRLRSGRVFIVGDAAHVHSPTGAQGLNTGIQDSFNLAWKIALVHKGLARQDLLNSYEAERLPVAAEMLAATTALYERLAAYTRAKPGGQPTGAKPGTLQWQNAALTQLEINYRWSPIVLDVAGAGGLDAEALKKRAYAGYPREDVHAGDRAPEAPGLVDASGSETRLHDIYKPTMHTILVFSPEADDAGDQIKSVLHAIQSLPEGAAQVVVLARHRIPEPRDGVTAAYHDTEGHAFDAYRVKDGKFTVVAVRPDAYIGAFVRDAGGVKEYFSRILVGA